MPDRRSPVVRPAMIVAVTVAMVSVGSAWISGCTTSAVGETATPTVIPAVATATAMATDTPAPSPTGTASASATSSGSATSTATQTTTPPGTPTCTPTIATYSDSGHSSLQTVFSPGQNVFAGASCYPPGVCARFIWSDPTSGTVLRASFTVPGTGYMADFFTLPANATSGTGSVSVETSSGACPGSPWSTFTVCTFTIVAATPTATPTISPTPT